MRPFILSFAACLALIAAVNVTVDLDGRWRAFGPGPMTASQNAWELRGASDYRAAKRALLERAGAYPAVALGSSHFFGLSRPGLLNLCVPGADLEDFADTWQRMKYKPPPRIVLLGADPWIFNGRRTQNGWSFERPGLLAWVKDAPMPAALRARWIWAALYERFKGLAGPLLGWEYFKDSLKALRHGSKNSLADEAGILERDHMGFRADGSHVQRGFEGPKADLPAFLASEALAIPDRRYSIEDWEFSNDRLGLLRAMLGEMKAGGIRVIVLATPEQDLTRAYMAAHHARAYAEADQAWSDLKAEGLVERLSLERSAGACGCSDAEFYDGQHPIKSCVDKLVSQLKLF